MMSTCSSTPIALVQTLPGFEGASEGCSGQQAGIPRGMGQPRRLHGLDAHAGPIAPPSHRRDVNRSGRFLNQSAFDVTLRSP